MPFSPAPSRDFSPEHEHAIAAVLRRLLAELVPLAEERVTEQGPFRDCSVKGRAHFSSPEPGEIKDDAPAGTIQLLVLHMNSHAELHFANQRFLSIRVAQAGKESAPGGFLSSSCLHGTRAELLAELRSLATAPDYLVQRVLELADGLPTRTNPDLWR